MRPEEIEALLGGYATGTLTEQERDALFRAALTNQNLFNALADEQALKELLDDPASRRELLDALGEARMPFLAKFRMWMGRPASWAVAGSMAAAVLAVVVLIRVHTPMARQELPVEMAKRTAPAPELPAEQVTAPVKAPAKPVQAAKPRPESAGLEESKKSASEPSDQRREKDAAISASPSAGLPSAIISTPPLGLRYSILRAGAAGNFEKADPRTVFESGDQIRLAVEPNGNGYLSVALQDTQGTREVLFGNPVEAQRTYLIPPTVPLRLESLPGEIKFLVTLSRGPERPRAAGTLVKSLKEKEAAGRKAESLSVADKPADPNAPVSVEIPIRYQ